MLTLWMDLPPNLSTLHSEEEEQVHFGKIEVQLGLVGLQFPLNVLVLLLLLVHLQLKVTSVKLNFNSMALSRVDAGSTRLTSVKSISVKLKSNSATISNR